MLEAVVFGFPVAPVVEGFLELQDVVFKGETARLESIEVVIRETHSERLIQIQCSSVVGFLRSERRKRKEKTKIK